jgi:hypothetical protein
MCEMFLFILASIVGMLFSAKFGRKCRWSDDE